MKLILSLLVFGTILRSCSAIACSTHKVGELTEAQNKIADLEFDIRSLKSDLINEKKWSQQTNIYSAAYESCKDAVREYIKDPATRDYWETKITKSVDDEIKTLKEKDKKNEDDSK